MVLVPLVARDRGLVGVHAAGELALRHAAGDAQPDQDLPEALEVLELAELPALEPLVALDLLGELEMERLERLAELRDLRGREALLLPRLRVLGESLALGLEAGDRLLVLGFAADHGVRSLVNG